MCECAMQWVEAMCCRTKGKEQDDCAEPLPPLHSDLQTAASSSKPVAMLWQPACATLGRLETQSTCLARVFGAGDLRWLLPALCRCHPRGGQCQTVASPATMTQQRRRHPHAQQEVAVVRAPPRLRCHTCAARVPAREPALCCAGGVHPVREAAQPGPAQRQSPVRWQSHSAVAGNRQEQLPPRQPVGADLRARGQRGPLLHAPQPRQHAPLAPPVQKKRCESTTASEASKHWGKGEGSMTAFQLLRWTDQASNVLKVKMLKFPA